MENKESLNPENRRSRWWIKYIITFIIGGLVSLALLVSRGAFQPDVTELDMMRYLCDAFFVPGILLLCFGGFAFVSKEGAFDGLMYGIKIFGSMFRFGRSAREYTLESFADYKERKASKAHMPCLFLAVIGAVFVGIAIVFLIRFNALDASLSS